MTVPARLVSLRQELYAKQTGLQRIYEESRKVDGDYDFTKAEAFEHLVTGRDHIEAQSACIDMLRSLEEEAKQKQADVMTLQAQWENEQKLLKQISDRKEIEQKHFHAEFSGDQKNGHPAQQLSLGQLVKRFYPEDVRQNLGRPVVFAKTFENFEVKTLMQTTAGWAPESTRVPRLAEFAHRPIQITDLFPVGNTSDPLVKWMEETTSTNAAVEIGEGVTYPEATFVWTERSSTVRKIAVSIAVTDEQLADVEQVATIIDNRLRFFVQQRLDLQLLNGNGVGDNLLGLLNTPGIQIEPMGANTALDAIYNAMTKVRVTGRSTPSVVIIHPNDFAPIRTLKANGLYVWGHPSESGVMRMWGVPIVEADVIAENTAVTGDFSNQAMLWMRQGVELLAGYSGTQFVEGKQTIRCSLRGTLAVWRPAAFCTITGI
jgi:HK97 family phage major capsid protein